MIEHFINNFDKIIGSIVVAVFGGYITYRIYQKTRFNQVALSFRNEVLAELEGLYPVTQHWDMNTFSRFPKSITKIETAASKFRFSVVRKRAFDAAVKEYCDYCKKTSWNECAGWSMYPTMRKEGEISPRDKFDLIVKNLLSFAEEK